MLFLKNVVYGPPQVRYNYVLCLLVSFWYYYICNLSRSSQMEVFFKNLFLKISQNSQKNACAGFSFKALLAILLK